MHKKRHQKLTDEKSLTNIGLVFMPINVKVWLSFIWLFHIIRIMWKKWRIIMSANDNSTLAKKEITKNIGIDLGTTNTVVSYFDKENNICNLKIGASETIPSVIFFNSKDEVYFGNNALKRCRKNSQSVVKLFKRKIGNPKEYFTVKFSGDNSSKVNDKYYVIDTNCLIDKPDIFTLFDAGSTIILPITVTQELLFRAEQAETKYSAEKALENIAEKDKYNINFLFEESDVSMLPKDFFKNFQATTINDENDNKVLSIAIKFQEKHPVLISSDYKLKVKAAACQISAMSLKDFCLDNLSKSNTDDKIVLSGEDATALFLRYIRRETLDILHCDNLNAVITVPANFTNIETEATKRAAIDAGFNKIHIEKEPIAAAIAYSMDSDSNKNILIYDFGGGTFDVAIIKNNKAKNEFDILGVDGNPQLGGQDFTDELVKYILEILEDENDLSLFDFAESSLSDTEYFANRSIIETEAERVKQSLSYVTEETIELVNLFTPEGTSFNKRIPITREEFNSIVGDIAREPNDALISVIKESNLHTENIDIIIMSGGTSLIPLVRDKVQNFFGKIPFSDKNPATLIANGAAIIANTHFSENDKQKAKCPVRRTKTVTDFGIATDDYDFDCIIPAGTQLPVSESKKYYLINDGQNTIDIKIYSRKKNRTDTKVYRLDFVDLVTLSNIPSFKKQDVEINVNFELTEEYELKVSADIVKISGEVIESNNIIINRESTK